MTILIFIVTILILVLIHEFGHFLAARKFGIKILEFGFGIPPRVVGKKWGETLVSLNWLPLGGFVRLLGEDDTDSQALKDKRSFAVQKVWKRIVVVVAGVTMNLLLAWVLFYATLSAQGFKTQIPLLVDHHFVGVNQTNEQLIVVSNVAKGSPADQVHLQSGDRIIALNSQSITSDSDFIDKVKALAGKQISLTVSDIQKQNSHSVELTPRINPPDGEGAMGVALGSFNMAVLEYQTPLQKLWSGPVHSYNLTVYSIKAFGRTIQTAMKEKTLAPVSQNVAGPVGITRLLGDILSVKNPLLPYLDFLAMLSLNLAVINLFPFPGLDGGRLVFLLWEAITRRKPSPVIEKYVHSIGLVVLIGLILLVTVSDIKKLF